MSPLPVSAQGNKYGVFVGIGEYKTDIGKLPSSPKDARNVCKVFSADCGTGNTKLLLDKEATRQNILNSIIFYQNKVKKGDLFVFYYSGHGTLFPDRLSEELDEKFTIKFPGTRKTDKKLYDSALVPFDSNQTTSGKRWRNLILDDELYRLFAEFTRKGARVVFISDSCHSGGQAKGGLGNEEKVNPKLGAPKFINLKTAIGLEEKEIKKEEKEEKEMQPVVKPETLLNGSYLLVASSAENELSYSQNPDTGTENSLFTYCLLKVFEDFRKKNKKVKFTDILSEVKPMVVKFAKDNEVSQTPFIEQKYFKGDLNLSLF